MKERNEIRFVQAGLDQLTAIYRAFGRKRMGKRIAAGILSASMILTNVGINAWATETSAMPISEISAENESEADNQNNSQIETEVSEVTPDNGTSAELTGFDEITVSGDTVESDESTVSGDTVDSDESTESGDTVDPNENEAEEETDPSAVPVASDSNAAKGSPASDGVQSPAGDGVYGDSAEAAADGVEELIRDNTCVHHPTHTESCGYTEGHPCAYENDTETGQSGEKITGSEVAPIFLDGPEIFDESYKPSDSSVPLATDNNADSNEDSFENRQEGTSPSQDVQASAPAHVHDEECGYVKAQSCGFICPICEPESQEYANISNAIDIELSGMIADGYVCAGETINLLEGVSMSAEQMPQIISEGGDGYNLIVYTVASETESEPDAWNKDNNTLTPESNENYVIIYAVMSGSKIVAAKETRLNVINALTGREVSLHSQFSEYVYAGNKYPIEKYVIPDPDLVFYNGKQYDVHVRVKGAAASEGQTLTPDFYGTYYDEELKSDLEALLPQTDHMDRVPITVTLEAYITTEEGDDLIVPVNAGETITITKILSQGDVQPELKDDSARISAVGMGENCSGTSNGITDGTTPFDGKSGAGNDANYDREGNAADAAHNNIVRTYDTVTYMTAYKTELQKGAYDTGYEQGRVYFEYFIPGVKEGEIQLEAGSMGWLSSTETEAKAHKNAKGEFDFEFLDNPQGAVFRGSFLVKGDTKGSNAIGASEKSNPLVVRILAMKNGRTIKPEFTYWLAYNKVGFEYDEDNDGVIDAGTQLVGRYGSACKKHGLEEFKRVDAEEVYVSAAPAFNVIVTNTTANYIKEGDFDFSGTNSYVTNDYDGKSGVWGRLTGFGLILQLRQNAVGTDGKTVINKGLRGVELPDPSGDIEFDIEISTKVTLTRDDGGKDEITVKPSSSSNSEFKFMPQLYAAGPNESKATKGRTLPGGVANYASHTAPANKRTAGIEVLSTCLDGGSWTFTQDETNKRKIHVKVSGYKLDLTTLPSTCDPNAPKGNTYYNPEVVGDAYWNIDQACFSTGQIWVFQPFETLDGQEITDYYNDNANTTTTVTHIGEITVDGKTVPSLKAKTIGDTDSVKRADTFGNDDSRAADYALNAPGSIDSFVLYCQTTGHNDTSNALVSNQQRSNGDYATIGDHIWLQTEISNQGASPVNVGQAYDQMIKFDDRFFQPGGASDIWVDTGAFTGAFDTANGKTYKVLYGTYRATDNGGWHNSSDSTLPNDPDYDKMMRQAGPEDLDWYLSLDEIKNQNKVCCAVLFEYRGVRLNANVINNYVGGYVQNTAIPGQVYMICDHIYMWTESSVETSALEWINAKYGKNYTSAREPSDEEFDDYFRNNFHTWQKGDSRYPENGVESLPRMYWVSVSDHPDKYKAHIMDYDYSKEIKGHYNSNPVAYKKASYDSVTGAYKGGDHAYFGGDSCLALSHKDSVTIDHLPQLQKFDLDYGQRYVGITVTPKFEVSEKIQGATHGTTIQDVVITITLPEDLHYEPNSGFLGGEIITPEGDRNGKSQLEYTGQTWMKEGNSDTWSNDKFTWTITQNEDGTTTLTLMAKSVEVDKNYVVIGDSLPDIHFTCKIGNPELLEQDVKDGHQFTLKASITDKDIPKLQLEYGSDTTGFSVIKGAGNKIYKSADQFVVEAGKPMSFTMSVQNTSPGEVLLNKLIVDQLPFDGDSRGSNFTSSYESGNVDVLAFSAGGYSGDGVSRPGVLNSVKFYYTTNIRFKDKKTSDSEVYPTKNGTDYNPEDELYSEESHTGYWKELTLSTTGKLNGNGVLMFSADIPEEDQSGIVAIAAYGNIDPQNTLLMNVTIQAKAARPGETVINGMSMDATEAKSASGYSYVARREVSGRTWLDSNHNGVQDEGEDMLNGVTVKLIDIDNNKIVGTMQTGAGMAYNAEPDTVVKAVGISDKMVADDTLQKNDGAYKFVNVPGGNYKIEFESTSGVIDLKDYVATRTDGVSSFTDSDAAGSYDKEGLLNSTAIDMVNMPPADQMGTQVFRVEHQDSGFHKVNLRIVKTVDADSNEAKAEANAHEYQFDVTPGDGVDGTYRFIKSDQSGANGTVKETQGVVTLKTGILHTFKIKGNGWIEIQELPLNKELTVKEQSRDAKFKPEKYEHQLQESGVTPETAKLSAEEPESYKNSKGTEVTSYYKYKVKTEPEIEIPETQKDSNVVIVSYTNQYRELIDIIVQKIWDDADNVHGLRPENIKVGLYTDKNGELEKTEVRQTGEQNPATLRYSDEEGSNWRYTWTKLYRYDTDKQPIQYTVKELGEDETPKDFAVKNYRINVGEWEFKTEVDERSKSSVTITNTLPMAKVRIAKWIDKLGAYSDYNDLLEDEFVVKAEAEGFSTELVLQHAGQSNGTGERVIKEPMVSGYLLIPLLGVEKLEQGAELKTTLTVGEIVPKEYEYVGLTSGSVGSAPDTVYLNDIQLYEGDNGIYVVHNIFNHSNYFHDDSSVMNVFDGTPNNSDGFDASAHTPGVPTASRPPEAIMEDRKVRTVELDTDERLI